MERLEVRSELSAEERSAVFDLVARVQVSTGHQPMSDHLWLDLVHGGRHGSATVLRWRGDRLIGCCQISNGHESWAIELVVDPSDGGATARCGGILVNRALQFVADSGGGHVHWWVFEPNDTIAGIASDNGLSEGRTLFQMRVPLPLSDAPAEPVPVRSFRVGADEPAWLDVNNAAFAWHPEQGGWDLPTLQQREREPWFDPDGFLLHERDGRLAAFCWTKIHPDHEPPLGEIYVIAVHPDFHGLGLGRALTVAGLTSLSARGMSTGMLYVDRDNVGAVELYRRLGFTVHRTDRAYVGDVATSFATPAAASVSSATTETLRAP